MNYLRTGVTFSDPTEIAAASLINPTFVYSLGGDGCCIHHGTDPLVPFHLANLFGNAKGEVSVAGAVKSAKNEFRGWCLALHVSINSTSSIAPVIRFFLGEATVVCSALEAFAKTGTLELRAPIAQWTTQLVQLSKDAYVRLLALMSSIRPI